MSRGERPDITVIIPTRNRAESLRETLDALAQQETAGAFTSEVLVVDNGSSDHTRHLVEEFTSRFPVPLYYLYEERIGQAWALNAGLRAAQGQFLAITDDDMLPAPTWLRALWTCFIEERADGVAGRILPRWMAPRPAWLTEEVAMRLGGLGCLDYGPFRLRSVGRHNLRWVGGNMAIRREVSQRVGEYATQVGRTQDSEYYDRCVRHALKIVYEPSALTFHKLGLERMTPNYFRWFSHTTGYYHAYFRPPWREYHLVTLMPIGWYIKTLGFAAAWVLGLVTCRPWATRFRYELQLRWRTSLWLHRLQLWPRQWTGLIDRSSSPKG